MIPILFFSCFNSSHDELIQSVYHHQTRKIEIRFYYNPETVNRIKQNLNTFKQFSIHFNCRLVSDPDKELLKRNYFVQYNHWDNFYLIDDGKTMLKLVSAEEVIEWIQNPLEIDFPEPIQGQLMEYDYRLIFVDLAPPFKMFENDKEIGNIVKKDIKIKINSDS